MAVRSLPSPKRYARVLLELAQERGELAQWRRTLQQMAVAVEDATAVSILESPGLTPRVKQAALRELLPGLSEMGYNFLGLLARRRALALLPRVLAEFESAADAAQGVQRVEVRTAVPLEETQQRRIAQGLAAALGKEVRLVARVEPALLGGMVVRVGDRVMDGSTRGRLQAMRQTLAEAR